MNALLMSIVDSKTFYLRYFKNWVHNSAKYLASTATPVRGALVHYLHDGVKIIEGPCLNEYLKIRTEAGLKRDKEQVLYWEEGDPILEHFPRVEDIEIRLGNWDGWRKWWEF